MKLPWVGLLAVIAITIGWGIGLIDSTRINTVAAQAYADALDLQAQSVHERAIAAKLLACEQEGIDVRAQIAVKDRAFKASQEQYTEMVIGLREQLQQAHVPERIVQATR